MKQLLLSVLAVGFASADPPPAQGRQEAPAEKVSAPAPKVRFKGKIGAPGRNTVTATRGDNLADLRIIAIAPGEKNLKPGEEPATAKTHPRLWWHQSEATADGELRFALWRIDGKKPGVIFQSGLRAMGKGFNVVDLAGAGAGLENGATYQWTIIAAASPGNPQAFCRMKKNPTFEGDGLEALAESGNWYELFDAAATAAAKGTDAEAVSMAELRGELLRQIGLDSHIAAAAPKAAP